MKRFLYLSLLSFSFSQISVTPDTDISQLKNLLQNASRTGQVVWIEEFSGLT